MNVIVSVYFNEDWYCNTTGDYNICKGLIYLTKKFKNFCIIGENIFNEKKLYIYNNAVNYFKMQIRV